MTLEALNTKKQLYNNLKLALERVESSLSSSNFNDDILCSKRAIADYFAINGVDNFSSKLEYVNDQVSTNMVNIKEMIVFIDNLIENIDKQIIDMSMSEI